MLRVTLATNPDSHFSGLGHRQHKRLCCHTRCQGLCTEPAKIETAERNNAEESGAGAQRREPKAVSFWRPVDRLVSGRSPPRSPLATNAACPLPNSLHQRNGWRKEPERKQHQPDYRLNWTAP